MDQANQKVFRRVKTYVLNATVAAGVSKQFPLQIDQGHDFEWVTRIASSSDNTGALLGFRIGIQDAASGRQLIICNPPPTTGINPDTTFAQNYFGAPGAPMFLVQPYVFQRGTTVWVTIDNSFFTNTGITVEIVFEGFELVEEETQGRGSSGQLVKMAA